MVRTAYDSTSARAIYAQHPNAQIVLGYDDALYAWSDGDWALFPNAIKVHIVALATTNSGTVLDCEKGNCTPAQSVDWVLMRRRAGVDPTVYCNQHDPVTGWPAVHAAFQARGVPEPHYWVADYDGVAEIPAGAIAKQYIGDEALNIDTSVVADYWPGVDPAPIDPPPPAAVRRNDMHADLKLNAPVVFTNPAAVLGGTSYLLLASDFGDATVRIATFSLKAGAWNVLPLATIGHAAGAYKLALPPDTNKVNVEMVGGGGAVGLDVLA